MTTVQTDIFGVYFTDGIGGPICHMGDMRAKTSPAKRKGVGGELDDLRSELPALIGSALKEQLQAAGVGTKKPKRYKVGTWIGWSVGIVGSLVPIVLGVEQLLSHLVNDAVEKQSRTVSAKIDELGSRIGNSLGDLNNRLGKVETAQDYLRQWLQVSLPAQVKAISQRSLNKESLNAVAAAFNVAHFSQIVLPSDDVYKIRKQIAALSFGDSELQSANAALISYISPSPFPNQRPCGDIPPAAMLQDRKEFAQKGLRMHPGLLGPTWKNCTLDLNAPLSDSTKNAFADLAKQPLKNVICIGCNVVYAGGPSPLLAGSLTNFRFFKCAFRYVPKSQPSPAAERFIRGILEAANISDVEVRS